MSEDKEKEEAEAAAKKEEEEKKEKAEEEKKEETEAAAKKAEEEEKEKAEEEKKEEAEAAAKKAEEEKPTYSVPTKAEEGRELIWARKGLAELRLFGRRRLPRGNRPRPGASRDAVCPGRAWDGGVQLSKFLMSYRPCWASSVLTPRRGKLSYVLAGFFFLAPRRRDV